ncbi:MAG TPA: hypothetical protein VGI96_50535 [Streptosporangiaceae bacterium]
MTQVGPGTAMAEVMRRYWIPVLLREEIPDPDGDPVRVRLMGEDLIAFRVAGGLIVEVWGDLDRTRLAM